MTLHLFIWLVVGMVAFQLFLLGYLVLKKIIRQRKEKRLEEVYMNTLTPFVDYVADPENSDFHSLLESLKEREVILERLLNHYISVTKDSASSPILQRLSKRYLSKKYRNQLTSSSWSTRMNTLHYIEDFKVSGLADNLLQRLQQTKQWTAEAQQLCRALAALNDERVLEEMERFSDLPTRHYVDVLMRFNEEATQHSLQKGLSQGNASFMQAALIYIGQKSVSSFLPQVEQMLKSEKNELRIQALKTIQRLEYISDPQVLAVFFSSENWVERMLVARISGVLRLSRYQRELNMLLGDSVWWVRYAAAEAFTNFNNGDLILTHLSEEHEDRYARDMANQWKSLYIGGTN